MDAGETLEQALIRGEEAVVPLAYGVVARMADPDAPCVTYHMFAVSAWEGQPASSMTSIWSFDSLPSTRRRRCRTWPSRHTVRCSGRAAG